jgi:glycerate kinase
VIEMSRAAGRTLVPHPRGEDPVDATTTGVGELVLAAVGAGALRIVIGCGGSATTDGGWGALRAIGGRDRLGGAELVVASDVLTPFGRAAEVFGPQKGATPEQVARLTARLDELADRYRHEFGVDVASLPGAGAAGGLAGGLAALGATIEPGFPLVAGMVGLAERIERAQLVVTGEGHLDPPSFEGKVVGGVIGLVGRQVPVLCVVGDADRQAMAMAVARPDVEVVSLVRRAGQANARHRTIELIESVVAEWLGPR